MNDAQYNYGLFTLKKGAEKEKIMLPHDVNDQPEKDAVLLAADLPPAADAGPSMPDDETLNDLKQSRRNRNISFIKLIAIMSAIATVIIISTLAWFTMNKDVSSGGMSVSTKAITFNIKSKGTIPYYAPFEAATEYKTGIADANNEYYLTGTNNDSVQWRMDGIAAEQLQPGAYGKLTFWVVPKDNNTTLDMEFSVSMRGFALSNETWTEITDTTALGYLNSHILFFRERYPTTYANEATTDFTYKGLITEPYQVNGLTESDAVTIYWIWPETFSQMIADTSASSHIAYDSTALTEIKDYVIARKTNLFPAGTENLDDNVTACCSASSTATASEITAAISTLDSGYNTGDSVIGSQIRGALTALKAEAIAEHTSP